MDLYLTINSLTNSPPGYQTEWDLKFSSERSFWPINFWALIKQIHASLNWSSSGLLIKQELNIWIVAKRWKKKVFLVYIRVYNSNLPPLLASFKFSLSFAWTFPEMPTQFFYNLRCWQGSPDVPAHSHLNNNVNIDIHRNVHDATNQAVWVNIYNFHGCAICQFHKQITVSA